MSVLETSIDMWRACSFCMQYWLSSYLPSGLELHYYLDISDEVDYFHAHLLSFIPWVCLWAKLTAFRGQLAALGDRLSLYMSDSLQVVRLF